jgi:hypothetical protein
MIDFPMSSFIPLPLIDIWTKTHIFCPVWAMQVIESSEQSERSEAHYLG